MKGKTLFDKIWEKHIVKQIPDGPCVLFIDREYMHEVTSPQAFEALRKRGIGVLMPHRITATCDHNVPTKDRVRPLPDALSEAQISTLEKNTKDFGLTYFGLDHQYNGIVHVIGPELGLTQPGMTIVCGDSHTSTHGALGCIAFGIGTGEVENVTASQCLLQYKPMQMRITVNNNLQKGVTSKDLALYILSKKGTDCGTKRFIEFAGSAIKNLSVEARMTLCNMSIEMGARGGIVAPDQLTFDYVKGRKYAPQGADFDKAVESWKQLATDANAIFDDELTFDAAVMPPMITYGTNPGMGIEIDGVVPSNSNIKGLDEALKYMGLQKGEKLLGKPIDYVFIGSCTNGRIEDLRMAAQILKGRKIAKNVEVLIVPGSNEVMRQAEKEGLNQIFKEAGAELRLAGCSACLAMNADKIPAGKYCVSTSNRNFEGRQGTGARTMLASPYTAAAAAVTGVITDPRQFL